MSPDDGAAFTKASPKTTEDVMTSSSQLAPVSLPPERSAVGAAGGVGEAVPRRHAEGVVLVGGARGPVVPAAAAL